MTTLTPRWSVQNSDSVYVFLFFFFSFSLRLLCCLLNQSIEFSVSFCRVKFLQFSLYQWGDMNSCVLKKNYCCTLYKMEEKKGKESISAIFVYSWHSYFIFSWPPLSDLAINDLTYFHHPLSLAPPYKEQCHSALHT